MKRSSGILLAMSSLPSPYGIGTMGSCAYEFIDFLKASGQSYWQLLPLGPTGFGDSPYASFSGFAGNPYLIDPEKLIREGLLELSEVESICWGEDPERVDYGRIYQERFHLLRKAYARGKETLQPELEQFRRENPALENYALFMSLKKHFSNLPWTQWPDREIVARKPHALRYWTRRLEEEIGFYLFQQYEFYRQWGELRAYAQAAGISFIGDIPIYVAMDSADVWCEPQFFQLDEQYEPKEVSGVPPDAFTEDGQLWGNPIYDWERMKADGYGWWIRRVEAAAKLYDVIRLDHFRGFESFWAVPAGDSTAKNGQWRKGPDIDLVGMLKNWFHELHFIAEDLGVITPAVRKLLDASGFPGMKVLEFAFDAKGESAYLPHNCGENSVCYVGTHDNETILGWVEREPKENLAFAEAYAHITEEEGWCRGMLRTGMASGSALFIAQMQDLLELGSEGRMNTPGTAQGNWCWRMRKDALSPALTRRLLEMTRLYRRCPLPPEETADGKTGETDQKEKRMENDH